MILRKIIFSALFFGVLKFASAQFASYRPGFIIDQKQDTVRGFLLYKENNSRYESCSFKTENAEPTEYKPNQLIAYHFDNDSYFESRQVTIDDITTLFFAEILAQGKASLLRVKNKFFLEDSEKQLFLLETKTIEVQDGGDTRVYNKELYKGVLSWKFTDCTKASGKIKSTGLEEKALTKLFELYNSCFQENIKSFKNNKPWSVISAGISVGLIATNLKLKDEDMDYLIDADQFNKDKSLSVGASFNFMSPRISEKFQLNIDVLYQQQTFESLVETLYDYRSYYFEYSSIQVPLSITYILLTDTKIKPALELGISSKFSLNSSSLFTEDDVSLPGTVYSDHQADILKASNLYIYPFLGAVISSEMKSQFGIFLKCRYHYAAKSVFVYPSVRESGLSISTGLLYRIKK